MQLIKDKKDLFESKEEKKKFFEEFFKEHRKVAYLVNNTNHLEEFEKALGDDLKYVYQDELGIHDFVYKKGYYTVIYGPEGDFHLLEKNHVIKDNVLVLEHVNMVDIYTHYENLFKNDPENFHNIYDIKNMAQFSNDVEKRNYFKNALKEYEEIKLYHANNSFHKIDEKPNQNYNKFKTDDFVISNEYFDMTFKKRNGKYLFPDYFNLTIDDDLYIRNITYKKLKEFYERTDKDYSFEYKGLTFIPIRNRTESEKQLSGARYDFKPTDITPNDWDINEFMSQSKNSTIELYKIKGQGDSLFFPNKYEIFEYIPKNTLPF